MGFGITKKDTKEARYQEIKSIIQERAVRSVKSPQVKNTRSDSLHSKDKKRLQSQLHESHHNLHAKREPAGHAVLEDLVSTWQRPEPYLPPEQRS